MSIDKSVRLNRNGPYWRAIYRDSAGVRRFMPIGKVADLSKRQAQAKCAELADRMGKEPRTRDQHGKPPTLKDWGERYPALIEPDVADATVEAATIALKYLADAYGKDTRIDRVSREMADDWRTWLMTPTADDARLGVRTVKGKGLAPATAAGHVRYVKAAYKRALHRGLVAINPFDGVTSTPPHVEHDWADISEAQVEAMVAACPTPQWKALIGLCAWAGLRRGEAMALTRADIKWEARKLVVRNIKTGSRTGRFSREVYLEPKLERLLLDVSEAITEDRIANVGDNNLHRTMLGYRDRKQGKCYKGILEAAGVPRYRKPFHTLRKNRATTWRAAYPEHVVDAWLGHGPEVAREHYAKVPESYYGQHQDELARLRAEVAKLKAKAG